MAASERGYLSGFGNEFASEAIPGALPRDQNAPQKPPLGLYIEELNGTAFTAPRGVSRSDWTYRIRPSSSSSIVRGQSSFNSRESDRSASSRPSVWQRGQ